VTGIVKDVAPDQETEDVQDLEIVEGDHAHEIVLEIVEEVEVEIKDRQLKEIMIKKKKDLKTPTKNTRKKAEMLVNILILKTTIPIDLQFTKVKGKK